MKILFIQDDASVLGGTKTLIARLARKFIDHGDEVSVLFKVNRASSSVLNTFPDQVRFFFFDPYNRSSFLFPYCMKRNLPHSEQEYDVVISLSLDGYYFSLLLQTYYQLSGSLVYYVVNPQAISCDQFRWAKMPLIRKGNISESLVFMNEECRRHVSEYFSDGLRGSTIIPLPVDALKRRNADLNSRRIVSIGRIDPLMKSYNWHLIAGIKQLHRKYPNLTWEVYGNGMEESVLDFKNSIEQQGCDAYVLYCGEIAYSSMGDVLEGASAFVGMGTAAVEAASAGIPVVVPTAFAGDDATHGMLHELPLGNVGEYNDSLPTYQSSALLDRVLSMDTDQYQELCNNMVKTAEKYNPNAIFSSLLRVVENIQVGNRPRRSASHWLRYQMMRVAIKYRNTCGKRL